MMKEPLISIIIPVYNVEEYLDECLESVVAQTYTNLEIILVDDGSTDSSGKKCDKWQERDERIHVIHQKNGGLSEARNAGMKIATGEYVGFVDSDDVININMYHCLYGLVAEYGCSIASCRVFSNTNFNGFVEAELNCGKIRTYEAKEAMKVIIREEALYVTVWNKLYEKSLINDIWFENGKVHEDEFWSIPVISEAKLIVETDKELYGYRQRIGSTMNSNYSWKRLDLLEARILRLKMVEKKFPELLYLCKCNLRFECIRAMQLSMIYFDKELLKKAKKRIKEVVREYPIKCRDYSHLPLGRRIWCFCSNICFEGTCVVRNIFHYGP